MKNLLIKIRISIKFFILVSIATFLIIGIIAFIYKPIYKVTINGQLVGYCKQKSKLQAKIDNYIENGDEETNNVAFVEISNMPKYNLCLLKRGITTNDDDIYEYIKETGVVYYKYYAILEDNEEKVYVSDFNTAELVIQGLKEKNSSNIDNIQIVEKYETDLKDFTISEEAIASLYKEKEEPVVSVAKENTINKNLNSSKQFSTATNISKSTVALGVSLIKPITGTISSRFGSVSSVRSSAHTGLDIAASKGTPIKVASSGTVVWAGYKGSYGNLVVISHTNSVQTYYGHCSKLYVSAGQTVSQGDTIAAVGSTGNSTGPHLHFEIRVNGIAYNPQNYVY